MQPDYDPRRSARQPVALDAQCRTDRGLRDKGRILDLSPEGCCVFTSELFVRLGARVLVRPEGLEGLSGIVRWIEGNRAGIEFDHPLYVPVFDHLVRLHSSGEPVDLSQA